MDVNHFVFSHSWLHIDKGMVALTITSFFPMETKKISVFTWKITKQMICIFTTEL